MDTQTRAQEIADQVVADSALPGEALDILLAASAIVFRRMQREGASSRVVLDDDLFPSQAQVFLASTPR